MHLFCFIVHRYKQLEENTGNYFRSWGKLSNAVKLGILNGSKVFKNGYKVGSKTWNLLLNARSWP